MLQNHNGMWKIDISRESTKIPRQTMYMNLLTLNSFISPRITLFRKTEDNTILMELCFHAWWEIM